MTSLHYKILIGGLLFSSYFLIAGLAYAGTCEYYDPVQGEDVKKEMTQAECDAAGGEYKETSSTTTFADKVIDAWDTDGDDMLSCADLLVYTPPTFGCSEVLEANGICTRQPVTVCEKGDINCNGLIEDSEAQAMYGVFNSVGVSAASCL